MKNEYSLGVEFKEQAVLMALLKKNKDRIVLAGINKSENLTILQVPEVRSHLNALTVVSAISKSETKEKTLQFDVKMSEYEVELAVEEYVFNAVVESVYYDFYISGINDINQEEMDVNIIYSDAKSVNDIIKNFADVDLRVDIIELKENVRLLAEEYLEKNKPCDVSDEFLAALGCAVRGIA